MHILAASSFLLLSRSSAEILSPPFHALLVLPALLYNIQDSSYVHKMADPELRKRQSTG